MRTAPTDRRDGSLRRALRLDGLAVAALVASVLAAGSDGREDDGFFSDPWPDGLAVLAFALAIAAGVVAARALVREPLRTRTWRRGLLLVPTLIGVGALAFILGDLIFPA